MIEMTDEAKQTFFHNLHNQWIQPELDRRFGETGIPDGFKIWECLIILPRDGQTAIVKFNQEFNWDIKAATLANGKTLVDVNLGQAIYLYDVVHIQDVLPPTLDGERCTFMYLYWDGFMYQSFVDFLPNQPDYNVNDARFKFDGRVIAHHVQRVFFERVIRWTKPHTSQLREIGIWICTSLLPYPLSKIVERVKVGAIEEARGILIVHCDYHFLTDKLVETWKVIKVFQNRQQVFEEALQSYKVGFYIASISTLIGHVEGIIVDWLHEILPPTDVKWKTKSRIEQFSQVIKTIPQFEYSYREAFDSTIEFLKEESQEATPYQVFKNWLTKVDPNFPSRHAISHGKYEPEIYTQENSIKLFLLLDTICQFMIIYEGRVLGKKFE